MGYFVYKTTNTINGKIYIGVHCGDVDDGYLGSGKVVLQAIKKHGRENFIREILFEFSELSDALDKEAEIVDIEFVSRSDVYNVVVGGGMPPTHKGASHPLYGRKRPDSVRRMTENNPMKNADVKAKVMGMAVYKFEDGTRRRLRSDDPLVLSGECSHLNVGRVTVRDKSGNVFHVDKGDGRITTGEVVHVSKGLVRDRSSVAKWKDAMSKKPDLLCPHCQKTGRGAVMKRWHFDKCKDKI